MRKAAKNMGLSYQEGESVDAEVMRDMVQSSMLERVRADFNKRKRLNPNPPPEELEPEPPPAPVFRTAASAVVCHHLLHSFRNENIFFVLFCFSLFPLDESIRWKALIITIRPRAVPPRNLHCLFEFFYLFFFF